MMKKISILVSMILCFALVPAHSLYGQDGGVGNTENGNMTTGGRSWPAVTLPHTQIVLSSKLNENVKSIPVKEGDHVSKGDVLLKFDSREIEAQIAIMRTEADYEARIQRHKTRLKYLKREYDRSEELASGDAVISESKLDQDRTKWELAKSKLRDLRRQAQRAQNKLDHYLARKENYLIRAPIDGVVSKIWTEPGEMAQEGEKVLEIVDPEVLEIRAHLPEEYVGDIRPGQQSQVRFPCADESSLVATVYFVSPYVDSSSGTFLIKALAEDNSREIIPGMGCEVQFSPFKSRAETETSSH